MHEYPTRFDKQLVGSTSVGGPAMHENIGSPPSCLCVTATSVPSVPYSNVPWVLSIKMDPPSSQPAVPNSTGSVVTELQNESTTSLRST